MAEKERKARLFDIYNKLDAKSTIVYNGKKFKKSDILAANRRLMFEGVGTLHQAKNRSIVVTVIVLSDIMIFLQENNQKYFFITPENKPSIIPVRSLIARERQEGGGTKSLVILSSTKNLTEPERYEMDIQQPPTRDDWMAGIRDAVDSCSPGSDSDGSEDEYLRSKTESKHLRLRRLTAELRSKDLELAKLLEDKMRIMNEMLQVVASGDDHDRVAVSQEHPGDDEALRDKLPSLDVPQLPDYVSLVREAREESQSKERLLNAVQEACRLASSLYSSGTSLSRSASSVGERQSQDYAVPALPKRADTFNAFDNPSKKVTVQEINLMSGETDEAEFVTGGSYPPPPPPPPLPVPEPSSWSSPMPLQPENPLLLSLDPVQQKAAYQMTHYLNSLMCLVSEHFTSLER